MKKRRRKKEEKHTGGRRKLDFLRVRRVGKRILNSGKAKRDVSKMGK